MSLGPTAVQSLERVWFKDPLVVGEGWFVCWDDDDPIELVVAHFSDHTPEEVVSLLQAQGWEVKMRGEARSSGLRCFPDAEGKFGDSMFPAWCCWLEQEEGPPEKLLVGYKKREECPNPPSWAYVIYYAA